MREVSLHLDRADVGEKAQTAEVDAQDRHVVQAQRTRGVEHGAVAADHHDQVAVDAISREPLGLDRRGRVLGLFLQRPLDTVFLGHGHQVAVDLGERVAPVGLDDDAQSREGGGGVWLFAG